MSDNVVIVFGPTGNVGSITAQVAHDHGAKVVLAMRDIQKPIPSITADTEKEGSFERVQADLTQSETITAAVQRHKAKRAFIYLTHGTTDSMRTALEALKSAGIEFVVFLSSSTITGDPKEIPPKELIPYIHAQVELNLEQVFGSNGYMAIRPGAFATNTKRWAVPIKQGLVRLYNPEAKFDYVTPVDIGTVCGSCLARGRQDGPNFEYVVGPDMLSQAEAVTAVAAALETSVEIKSIDEEEETKALVAGGFPDVVAKYVIGKLKDIAQGKPTGFELVDKDEAAVNFEKYSGRSPMKFEEWVAQNTHLFRF